MYLSRSFPLGPHSEALKLILRARGEEPLFSQSSFNLWRLAHHRLQTRQVMLGEAPDPEQIAWVSKLNLDRPDLHFYADVLHINLLGVEARRLMQGSPDIGATLDERIERARQLSRSMQDLIASIEGWTSEVTGKWRPKIKDPDIIVYQEADEPDDLPIPNFPCPQVLSYNDIWLVSIPTLKQLAHANNFQAYMWTFHGASQIILRESLVGLLRYIANLQGRDSPDPEDVAVVQDQRNGVDALSAGIIRSFPKLMGFTHRDDGGPRSLTHGKMAGRLCSLFPMWVIQKAQFTSDLHKQTATEVTRWIEFRHGLQ